MEQRLAALFASVGNALDSTTYSYSDSDYLVRKALVEFLDGENALVASARKIQDSSEVVDSVLNYVISADFSVEDPAEWYRKAARIVVEFSDFAFRNEMSEDSARYAALLPEGHPRALNSITLTASAQRSALAEWMAADPRLDEEASAQIRKLYSMSSQADELTVEFEYLKAEAMVASGKMPEDLLPLTAAFNLTRAQRSAISSFFAKFRRRDRKGRFAEEFGRLSLILRDGKGQFFSGAPKIVGEGSGPNRVIVQFDGSDSRVPKGLYDIDATKGENVKAYLPTSAVEGLPKGREVVAEGDKQYAIGLDELLANKVETPLNWEKSGKGFKSKDGKFVAEPIKNSDAEKAIDRARERGDDLIIAGVGDGDAFDPEAADGSFLVADAKGKSLGVAQDWAGIQEIAVANGAEPGKMDDPSGVDVSGMTLEQLEREMGNPVDPSIPGSLDRYNKITDEFYRRGGYSALRKKQAQEREGAKPTDVKDMTLEELEGEMGEPVDPSKPGSLDRYNEVTDEFYKRGGYAELRKQQAQAGKTEEPDLDQDVSGGIDKSKLSPSMLGEGYNFSKEGENSWVQDGVGANGESYAVSKAPNGKWVVSERSGSEGDNAKERDLQSFDTAEEAFDFANGQGVNPNEFDEDWVNELMSEDGPDLDQNVAGPKNKLDASDFSPKDRESSQKYIDSLNQAIFNNDRAKLDEIMSDVANDNNISDKAYSALAKAKEARDARAYAVENALAGGSREDVEALLEDPEYAGWASRLEEALAVDLDQEAPTLSEKQSEPASGKQYAFLEEFLAERQLDPATEQALRDAIENKHLNKAQASALIGIGRAADFKPGVDPTKPSERMLNSLQGYLATKDLAPSEIKEVLDSLQEDGSRENVDALLNKLRRKKDKPVDLNQGASSMTRFSENSYGWEDVYNTVSAYKDKNGWEVEYTNPDLNDRGGQTWHSQRFNSEAEALAFAEELIKQNQDDAGYARAADDLMSTADLDQDVKGTLADAATDKQWDFLQSLLDGKKINNPELEAAVRSALADRNLTKGEVGAFIGQLRPLEDKPNVRREPSAKQIASIKRALLERDMTPEERKSMQDKLAAGLSFDEASEMLNDLKKREITPEGMDNLLRELKSEQDIDTLRYLLDKPEYSKYRTDVKEILRQLALDTEDPYLQEFIDAREDVDLDQDVADLDPETKSLASNALDLDGLGVLARLGDLYEGGQDLDEWTSSDGRVKVSLSTDGESDSEGTRTWNMWGLEIDGEYVAGGTFSGDDLADKIVESLGIEDPYNNLSNQEITAQAVKNAEAARKMELDAAVAKRARNSWLYERSGRDMDEDNRKEAERINARYDREIQRIKDQGAANEVDLDQDVFDSVGRDEIAEKLAEDIDALDSLAINGDELKNYLEEFDRTDYAPTALEMTAEVENMARYVDDPELKQRLRDLSSRLTDEIMDRFGVAEAARADGDDILDLYDYSEKVRDEVAIYFETDVDTLVEKLDDNGYYGDNRSGGAEARISENEDGTYTARVDYDRDGEEQTFEDRDEALAWAANGVAKYNSNVIPNTYDKDIDLEEEAKNAKTDAEAAAFADRLDEIARDLDENRGDPRAARELRSYGERIRDMIEKRDRQRQSEVESEPLNSETIDEMATDPDLNPAGYAQYVGDDLYKQLEASEKADPTGITNMTDGRPTLDSYESPDGRVKVKIDYDADFDGDGFVDASSYTVTIDGVRVGGKSLGFSDDVAADVQGLIEEHFSKKA